MREIAERLKADGVRVWLDEWEIRIGDSIPAKIEEGLERSRLLILCMSERAFGSDWATLESQTFRFRDPLNKERRFIPLRRARRGRDASEAARGGARRCGGGGLRAARSQVEAFATERGFAKYLETSAKFGTGCAELREAVMEHIRWDE